MEHKNIALKPHKKFGRGVFATDLIKKGDIVAEFDGSVYSAASIHDLRRTAGDDVALHAIQFSPHHWRDSIGIARYFNHSCESNCGILGLFSVVTLRDILSEEELVWDYALTEDFSISVGDSCECGSKLCRKVISGYSGLSDDLRQIYAPYTSVWLKEKYGIYVNISKHH